MTITVPAMLMRLDPSGVLAPGPLHPGAGLVAHGPLAAFVEYGANGDLELSDNGVEWRPGWLGEHCGLQAVILPWSEIRDAESQPILGRGRMTFLISLHSRSGWLYFVIADLVFNAVIAELRNHLGTP